MKLIGWYQYLAIVGSALWAGTGALAIVSIALSPRNWIPNLLMGLFFICFGWYLYFRAISFSRYYSARPADFRKNPIGLRFLRLDLLLVLLSCLAGALLLLASGGRVFREGYAVFG